MNPWVQPTSTSGFNPPSPGSTRTIRVQPAISGFNPHYPGTDKPSHPRVIPRGSLPRCTRAYPAPPVPVPGAPQSISVPNPVYRIPPVLHNIRRHHNIIHPSTRQGKWDLPQSVFQKDRLDRFFSQFPHLNRSFFTIRIVKREQ